MSDKAISVGDLVCIVRVCCPDQQWKIGMFGTVAVIDPPSLAMCNMCNKCGFDYSDVTTARVPETTFSERMNDGWYPLSWLRRIPPLSDLTGVSEDARKTDKVTA